MPHQTILFIEKCIPAVIVGVVLGCAAIIGMSLPVANASEEHHSPISVVEAFSPNLYGIEKVYKLYDEYSGAVCYITVRASYSTAVSCLK